MPLEDARAKIDDVARELDRRRLVMRAFAAVCAVLVAVSMFLAVKLYEVDTGVRRSDCARAIADETNRLDRDADRAFRGIVVTALRLPQGSPVTPELARQVDALDEADERLSARPPNQVLVDRTCPG